LFQVVQVSVVPFQSEQQPAEGVVDGDVLAVDLLELVGDPVHAVVVVVAQGLFARHRRSPAVGCLGCGVGGVVFIVVGQRGGQGQSQRVVLLDWEQLGVDINSDLTVRRLPLDPGNVSVSAGVNVVDVENNIK